jgi:hypothetical protein
MALAFWPAWGLNVEVGVLRTAWTWCELLLAAATAVTLWTGAQYARSAMAALNA